MRKNFVTIVSSSASFLKIWQEIQFLFCQAHFRNRILPHLFEPNSWLQRHCDLFINEWVSQKNLSYQKFCWSKLNLWSNSHASRYLFSYLDFYFGATMLKYEHPMMIVTNTKDIFLKRLKRTKKMIASDCSSQ